MRQLAGLVVAGAIVAAALYLTFELLFFDTQGEAKPDFSLQALVVLGLLVALVLEAVVGVTAEIRHLRERRRDREWSVTTGGGPRA